MSLRKVSFMNTLNIEPVSMRIISFRSCVVCKEINSLLGLRGFIWKPLKPLICILFHCPPGGLLVSLLGLIILSLNMLGSNLVNPPLCFGLVFLRAILGNVAFLTTTVACLVSMLVALLSKAKSTYQFF
jgi:hypothetical protein